MQQAIALARPFVEGRLVCGGDLADQALILGQAKDKIESVERTNTSAPRGQTLNRRAAQCALAASGADLRDDARRLFDRAGATVAAVLSPDFRNGVGPMRSRPDDGPRILLVLPPLPYAASSRLDIDALHPFALRPVYGWERQLDGWTRFGGDLPTDG